MSLPDPERRQQQAETLEQWANGRRALAGTCRSLGDSSFADEHDAAALVLDAGIAALRSQAQGWQPGTCATCRYFNAPEHQVYATCEAPHSPVKPFPKAQNFGCIYHTPVTPGGSTV